MRYKFMPIEHVSPIDVARALAPLIHLHPVDSHRPTSVDWFLSRCQLVKGEGELVSKDRLPEGMEVIDHGPLNPDSLAAKSSEHMNDNLSLFPIQNGSVMFGDVTSGYYNDIGAPLPPTDMSLPDPPSPLPWWLRWWELPFTPGDPHSTPDVPPFPLPGPPAPLANNTYFSLYQLRTFLGDKHGSRNWTCTAPMYVRIATQGEYYLISYFGFFAYQSGLGFYTNWDAVPLGSKSGWGAHIGDWERLTAKITINKNLVSLIDVDYEAHGDSNFVTSSAFKDIPLSEVPRLTAWCAWHSHAMYPNSGIFNTQIRTETKTFANDYTETGGPVWDTAANLQFISDDGPSWVRYKGWWGANIKVPGTLYEYLGSGPYGPKFHGYWTEDTHPGSARIKQWIDPMKTYYITDAKHGRSIVASDSDDEHIYHQDPLDRPNAKWVLEAAQEEGYYLIRDTKNQKCIVASNTYDGLLYQQPPRDRPNALWRMVKFYDEAGAVTIHLIDKKHNKAIVASDIANGHVYHQEPNNRPNARWALIPNQEK
jgi:hypothetical protein